MDSDLTASTPLLSHTIGGTTNACFDSICADTSLSRPVSLTSLTQPSPTTDRGELELNWLNSVIGAKLNLKRNLRDPPGVFHPNFCLSNGLALKLVYDGGYEEAETVTFPKPESKKKAIRRKEKVFSVCTNRRVLFVVRRNADQKTLEILPPHRATKLMTFQIPKLGCRNVDIKTGGEFKEQIYRANPRDCSNITIKRSNEKEIGKITGLGADMEEMDQILTYKSKLDFSPNPDLESGLESNLEKFIMTAFFISMGVYFKAEAEPAGFLFTCGYVILLIVFVIGWRRLRGSGVFGDVPPIMMTFYYFAYFFIYFFTAFLIIVYCC